MSGRAALRTASQSVPSRHFVWVSGPVRMAKPLAATNDSCGRSENNDSSAEGVVPPQRTQFGGPLINLQSSPPRPQPRSFRGTFGTLLTVALRYERPSEI